MSSLPLDVGNPVSGQKLLNRGGFNIKQLLSRLEGLGAKGNIKANCVRTGSSFQPSRAEEQSEEIRQMSEERALPGGR